MSYQLYMEDFMKKVMIILCLLLFAISNSDVSYADEPSSWSEEDINILMETGLFDYEKFGNYKENITREEFIYWAVTLYEVLQNEEINVDESISFVDTTNINALKAASVGITSGVGNDRFAPNQLLDRQTMVTFYIKLLKLGDMKLLKASEELFSDDTDIVDWAKPYVYQSRSNNIVSGVGNNKFDANSYASTEVCIILTKNILFESEGKIFTTKQNNNVISIEESQRALAYLYEEYPPLGSVDVGYELVQSNFDFTSTAESSVKIALDAGDYIDSVGLYKGDKLIQSEILIDGALIKIKSESDLELNTTFKLKIFTSNGKRYLTEIRTPKIIDFKKEEWNLEMRDYNSNVDEVYSFVIKIPANPQKGFNYPYYIGVPLKTASKSLSSYEMLVDVNNTGSSNVSQIYFEQMAKDSIGSGMLRMMAEDIGAVTVMPAFPRPSLAGEFYTHTLDRDSFFVTDEIIEQAKVGDFTRLDLQLKAMIEDAVIQFKGNGFNVSSKPIMVGFSASSGFANRYAMIHPESVKAVAVQHHTMMPIAEYNGNTLNFPSGVADLKEVTGVSFNEKAYKALPQFWFRGSDDYNDPTYFHDGWGNEGSAYRRIFGEDITVRKDKQVTMLKDMGFTNILFEEYEGIGHWYTEDMNADFVKWYNTEFGGK